MGRQMHMTRKMNKGILGVFLLLVSAIVCLATTGLADAPTLSDLQVISVTSSFFGDAWVVQLTVDISHQPLAAVSNLTLRAYDQLGGQVAEYVDHPFHPHSKSFANNYPV